MGKLYFEPAPKVNSGWAHSKLPTKPHTIPPLGQEKELSIVPELSAFDSVAAGFVAAEAEKVSDPKVAHPSQIRPLHSEWPGPIPFQSVA